MRIVLASEYFYPQTRGGTEMYVYQLAKKMIEHGHECVVLSLSNNLKESSYEDIPIHYISYNHGEFQESDNPANLHELVALLDSINPDVFHLHTLSPSLGTNHIVHLHEIGYKTIFTTHLPSFLCTRGDLLYKGVDVCDGFVSYEKCMDCILHSNGYNNELLKSAISFISKSNVITSILSPLAVVKNKIGFINKFKTELDVVVAVCEWQKNLLLLNGFDEHKVSLCRQSVSEELILDQKKNPINSSLTLGFIGRIVEEKGFHLLIDALGRNTLKNYTLNVAAIKSEHQLEYYEINKEKSLALNCNWQENLNAQEIIDFIDTLDVLVVPSTWLETGPYVIYEALARKVPVLAFNKGGSVELIDNNLNSFLVNSAIEFEQKLNQLIENPSILKDFSNHIQMNRTTEQLYTEMMEVYNSIL